MKKIYDVEVVKRSRRFTSLEGAVAFALEVAGEVKALNYIWVVEYFA